MPALVSAALKWPETRAHQPSRRFTCKRPKPLHTSHRVSWQIELLRTQEASVQTEPERLFKQGERVRLTEAPFAGIEGIYQMADGERRVMVLIEILSKPVAVRVAPASLRKVS